MIYRLGDAEPILDGDGHFIAPDANIIGKVRLAEGVSIWFGATLRGDNDWIEIGANSNVQDSSILHTDPGIKLTVGANVTIGHRAMLHGCHIGDGSLIGIGSTVLNNARIGSQCLVGAHALITEGKEFPNGVLILGSPAKVVRELNERELAQLAQSAAIYTRNGLRFREQLTTARTSSGQ